MKCERRGEIRLGQPESEGREALSRRRGGSMLSRFAQIVSVVCVLSGCAPFLSAQGLRVNKYEFSGDTASITNVTSCINSNNGTNLTGCPNQLTSTGIGLGSPVLYVIAVQNTGPAITTTLYDTVPLGFVWVSTPPPGVVQYAAFIGALLPTFSYPLTAFTPGIPTSIGPFTINTNGVLVFEVFGYYNIVGTGVKENFVSAVLSDSPGGNCTSLVCSSQVLTIPCPGLQDCLTTDLGIAKTVTSQNTTGSPATTTVTYAITITNFGPGDDIFPANLIQIADTLTNNSGFPVPYLITSTSFVCAPAICMLQTVNQIGRAHV